MPSIEPIRFACRWNGSQLSYQSLERAVMLGTWEVLHQKFWQDYMLNIMNETSYSFMSSLCNLANQCGIKEMKGFWSSQCLNKNTDVSQKMRTPFRISTPNNNHGKNCWLDSHDLIIIDTLYKRDKPGCHSCKNWRFTEFCSKAYW